VLYVYWYVIHYSSTVTISSTIAAQHVVVDILAGVKNTAHISSSIEYRQLLGIQLWTVFVWCWWCSPSIFCHHVCMFCL